MRQSQPCKDYAFDRTLAICEAREQNLDIVEANERTLQLDFDTDEAYQAFITQHCGRLLNFVEVDRIYSTVSRSGHKHVYIELPKPVELPYRIAMQAALGSDPVREFLNLMRAVDGISSPVILFEKKDRPEQELIYERLQ
jgi:hypothetical protein